MEASFEACCLLQYCQEGEIGKDWSYLFFHKEAPSPAGWASFKETKHFLPAITKLLPNRKRTRGKGFSIMWSVTCSPAQSPDPVLFVAQENAAATCGARGAAEQWTGLRLSRHGALPRAEGWAWSWRSVCWLSGEPLSQPRHLFSALENFLPN